MNYLNISSNGTECTVLFLGSAGLFSVLKKDWRHGLHLVETRISCSKSILKVVDSCQILFEIMV